MENKTKSRAAAAYCKAYEVGTLRGFPGWERAALTGGAPLDDAAIVYLHADLSVTTGLFGEPRTLVRGGNPEWREFCEQELRFAVPGDLESMGDARVAEAAVPDP